MLDVADHEVLGGPNVEEAVGVEHERSIRENGQAQENNQEDIENVNIGADIDTNETIEVIGEDVHDSVSDITNDTNVISNSAALTPFTQARLLPNYGAPLHPPVLLDLTNSSINCMERTAFPRQDLDTTSPGNICLQCPVCLDSLKIVKRTGRGMVSTVCGHIFCSRCLPTSIKANGSCPTCRRVLSNRDYHKIYV